MSSRTACTARGQVGRSDDPVIGRTVVAGRSFELREYVCFPPNRDATGDVESMGMLAGQSVGAIREILPAGQIVRDLADGVETLRQSFARS